MTYTLTKNNFASYNYSYDPNFDILRASTLDKNSFYYEEIEDNILLMLDDYDDSVIGFQIIDYSIEDKNEIKKALPTSLLYIFDEIEKRLN